MEGYKVALLWVPCLAVRLAFAFWQALADPRDVVEFVYQQMFVGGMPVYIPAWKVALLWVPLTVQMLLAVLGRSIVRPREMVEFVVGQFMPQDELDLDDLDDE